MPNIHVATSFLSVQAETSEDLYEWKDALENALAQAPSGAAALDHTLAQTSGGSLLTGQSGGLLQDDAVDTIEGSFEQCWFLTITFIFYISYTIRYVL